MAARSALFSLADRVLDGELAELRSRLGRAPAHGGAVATSDFLLRYLEGEVEDEGRFGLAYRAIDSHGRTVFAAPEGAWQGFAPLAGEGRRRAVLCAADGTREYRVVAERHRVPFLGELDLEIGYDLLPSRAELRRMDRLMLFGTPVALLFAATAGYALARRALAPLRAIEEVARRVSARGKGEQIPETGRGDEFDRLATALNAMLARLDGAIDANARFTADAAHELRTPLQALGAEVDLARREAAPESAVRAGLDRIAMHVERLRRLVGDLLTLARADFAPSFARERVGLAPLLRELLLDLAPLGEERGVRLSAGELPPLFVLGEPGALRRLFENLLENACLYADAGEVHLRLLEHEKTAVVTVEDEGPGLPEEERAQLFSRFWRGEIGRLRNPEGTGLGLSIAAAIARAHGGSIEAGKAQNGRGTRFTVTLPLDGG
jgi:signal transduction histidine kinase